MVVNRSGLRLNNELKKAVSSSDEYEEFITFLQFYKKERNMLTLRLRTIETVISDFSAKGGKITIENGVYTCSLDDTSYRVVYGSTGEVAEYSVKLGGKKGRDTVTQMHKLFFAVAVKPLYTDRLADVERALKNLENDNIIRGNVELRRLIRDDKYLTVSAIGRTDISKEDSDDPFGIFGDDDQ